MRPIRIQRKRTKGWKMPENTVYVGRPTRFGNPFFVGEKQVDAISQFFCSSNEEAVRKYKIHCVPHIMPNELEKLCGKNLACFCALDQPCHADVLLELANK